MRFLTVILFLMVSPALASERSGFRVDDVVKVDLLPGWRDQAGQHVVAIRFRLAKGWKTYWRHPGESGIAPRLDFAGSENLRNTEISWPLPQVFDLDGVQTIGYKSELILPIHLYPTRSDQDILLRIKMNFGVCKMVCMPVKVDLEKRLDRTVRAPDWKIKSGLRQRLDTKAEADVSAAICEIIPSNSGLLLRVTLKMPKLGSQEAAVVELSEGWLFVENTTTKRMGKKLVIDSQVLVAADASALIDRSKVHVTVLSPDRGVSIHGCTGGSP